jgi:hypothetical protein
MVMGYQDRETAFALGDVLASAIANRTAARERAARAPRRQQRPVTLRGCADGAGNGRVVLREVERLRCRRLDAGARTLNRITPAAADPIVAVLHAARQLGAPAPRVLKDTVTRGDVSGDKSSVVGYMAAGIWVIPMISKCRRKNRSSRSRARRSKRA